MFNVISRHKYYIMRRLVFQKKNIKTIRKLLGIYWEVCWKCLCYTANKYWMTWVIIYTYMCVKNWWQTCMTLDSDTSLTQVTIDLDRDLDSMSPCTQGLWLSQWQSVQHKPLLIPNRDYSMWRNSEFVSFLIILK